MEHDHKVHFEATEEDGGHQNNIIVKQSKEKIDIHVGFLQVFHKYQVQVQIPNSFLPKSEKISPKETQIPNSILR